MTDAITARLDLALDLARATGELTLSYFRTDDLGTEHKSDRSPVTVADRAAETLMRERIAAAFPDDGVLGEEEGEVAGTSGYRWILDPIDGTQSFVCGVPLFGTLIACEAEGEVVLGVVHCPAAGELVSAARDRGAWWSVDGGAPRRARVSRTARLAEASFSTTSPQYFPSFDLYRRVAQTARVTRGWSDCYGHLLVATGRLDVQLDPSTSIWDDAALMVVVEEAGGRFTDLTGGRRIGGGAAVSTNGLVHDEVLALRDESRVADPG